MRLATLLLAALLLAACQNLTPPALKRGISVEKGTWFVYAADRRGATMVPRDASGNTGVILCAEPVPDIALENLSKIVAKVTTPQGVSGEGSAEFSSAVIELAGRTQNILFLREAMYRLCEQGMNGFLSREQVAESYVKVLETVVEFGRAATAAETARALNLAPDAATRSEIRRMIEPGN